MSSLLHHIQQTEWQFFVTCTYKNSRTMSAKVRHSMQFQWMRRLAAMDQGERRGGAALRNLLFVIREEFGEQNNRLHWHALVSGLKPSLVRSTTCLFMMGYWEGIGGGMARVRVFDAAQDGTSYITKGLESVGDFTTAGANRYELGKFNHDDTLMLIPSPALLTTWKRRAAESRGLTRLALDRRSIARSDTNNHTPKAHKAGVDNEGNAWPGAQTSLALVGETPGSRWDTPTVGPAAPHQGDQFQA